MQITKILFSGTNFFMKAYRYHMKLSLCMIVKNEEAVLARCLESVRKAVDEIIIVDTGSTDRTKAIAKSFTDKIYNFKWIDDFSVARNFSFSKASGDYIMWLDADDIITSKNLEKIIKLKKDNDNSVDVYMLKYATAFDEKDNPTFVFYRERIVKNNKTFFWHDPVHEFLNSHGKIKYEDIEVYHKKIKATPLNRNLKIYEKHIKNGNVLTSRQLFYYARELFYNEKYKKAINKFDEFLRKEAWIENKIEACLVMGKCYSYLEDYEMALSSLFKSFIYSYPRSEILCEISNILIYLKRYEQAIPWLKLSLKNKKNYKSGAFILPECYDLIPHLQLCVCYYNLKKIKLAKRHNDIAYEINSNNDAVKVNKKFLDSIN